MHLETSISIPAPAAEVWAVLTDTTRYPDWNPFVRWIKGDFVVGKRIKAQLPGMVFTPRILAFDQDQELRWIGNLFMPGLFDGEHYFRLESKGDSTVFHHGEHFSGILVPLFRRKLNTEIKEGFEAMNEALRAEVARQREAKAERSTQSEMRTNS